MKSVAYIFTGQGAQYVGMGRYVYEGFDVAKKIFDNASGLLGYDLARLCFEGPKEEIAKTSISQPAILAASIATLRAFEEVNSNSVDVKVTAGLSLGEYTSLVAAGSLTFEQAVVLVRKRGQFMEEASLKNPGRMLCIIGLSKDEVSDICKASNTYIANLNCPGQVVISGKTEDVQKAAGLVAEKNVRSVYLDVSGPFHSPLMAEASQRLQSELENINLKAPAFPIVCNINAKYETSPQAIKENLVQQVSHTTRWEDSVRLISSSGITTFLEVGPGKVLRGLLRKIDPSLEVINIEDAQSIKDFKIT